MSRPGERKIYSLKDFSGINSADSDRVLADRFRKEFGEWLSSMKLPSTLSDELDSLYIPFINLLRKEVLSKSIVPVIGIAGSQGSGKSTFTALLSSLLEKAFDYSVISFSIDDFYLPRAERKKLSQTIHPLLITRGVPGTHEVDLGLSVIESLRNAGENTITKIPVFDKAVDDRLREQHWKIFKGRPSIILFEGWCVGAQPEPSEKLFAPINNLEKEHDSDMMFRKYVNDKLANEYKRWFSEIDFLVMLKVSSFSQVFEWRLLQEQKLKEKSMLADKKNLKIMSEEELRFFINHYERTTRNMLEEMPGRADIVMEVGDDHRVKTVSR